MSGNVQKTPLVDTLNSFAAAKAQEAINILGKALPASVVSIPVAGVPIVTVKFEVNDPTFTTLPNVTVPVLGSEYIRVPLQTNPPTKGVVFSIDAYLGGISGLGGGVADLTQRGNLSTLIFAPVGNTAFKAVDGNTLTLYGAPNGGTVVQDTVQNASSVSVLPTSVDINAVQNASTQSFTAAGIVLTAANGGSKLTMSNNTIALTTGGHTLTIGPGGIALDGIVFATHIHTGVTGGTSDTGPVA
jgi:hypothetical protein